MKILVTGGTGTVGRMVCKQLVAGAQHEVVILSRDPSKQMVNCPHVTHEIGRIEDEHFVRHVVRKHGIDGIIHTAANKHIGVCEDRPTEAIGANVIGSLNILHAIEESSVKRAVFVSSDKACNHDHVYGITKYLMEKLVSEYAERLPKSRLNCVRFGNIFGSSGSVVPIWQAKINRGQDIDLRIFKHGQIPERLALLPSEAAEFCLQVFDNPNFENGSILMKAINKTVNMKTLAEVMVEGSRSAIHEVPALSMESVTERNFSYEETERIVVHPYMFELTKRAHGENQNWPGIVENHMNKDTTRDFYKKVVEESKQWI